MADNQVNPSENTDTELIEYFKFQCEKGFSKRFPDFDSWNSEKQKLYRDRLEYEIEVILDFQFEGYFCIVQDVLNWCRENNIPIGCGRGSISGSLVAYCMYITELDSIKYGLIFERFLNPGRRGEGSGGLCDIDMDFSREHREQVLEYVASKYGQDCVCRIGTFGLMRAKNAVKNVARVLGHPYVVGDELSKLLLPPIHGKPQSLKTSIEKVPELKEHYNKNGAYGEILHIAEKFEGLVNNVGVHAAGLAIAPYSLSNKVPMFKGKGEEVTAQWEMNNLEKVGYVKFDFLGLDTLTRFHYALKLIKKRYNIDLDINAIDREDSKIFDNIKTGNVSSLFQLEQSAGISGLTVKVRPECLEDLSAILATYRPGPLCLSANSLVLMGFYSGNKKKRTTKHATIEELYKNFEKKIGTKYEYAQQEVVSVNLQDYSLTKSKIKAVYKSGKKSVYRIKIQVGLEKTLREYSPKDNKRSQRKTNTLKATKDHHFFTLNGWKRLENIEPGEYICILHSHAFGTKRKQAKVYGRKNFKNICFRHYQYKCVFCDWNLGTLDVNHVVENRYYNNKPENLSFLCPNHHRMYSENTITEEELIEARNKYTLPFTEEIMFVRFLGSEYEGEEETYDLELEGPHHNFIAGDFVVHNSAPGLSDYLACRAGEKEPEYLFPELAPILDETSGFLIYQENLIRMAVELAGYDLATADDFRKACAKKLPEKMAKHESKFKEGCAKNNLPPDAVNQIWQQIQAFAAYCFNKSHSIAYSLITYQCAYLKTYYPSEWMCAVMICDANNKEQIIKYIAECKRMGIEVLPPNINESDLTFSLNEKGNIVFGLSPIRNLGEGPVGSILEERQARGKYKDLVDFLQRADLSKINKLKVQSLIKSGCFDYTDENRSSLISFVDKYWEHKSKFKSYESKLATYFKRKAKCDQRLSDIANGKTKAKPLKEPVRPEYPEPPTIPNLSEIPDEERLAEEHSLLGFYIDEHPLDSFNLKGQLTIDRIKQLKDSGEITLACMVAAKQEITTKTKKERMAFLTLEDATGQIEAVAFAKIYSRHLKLIESGKPLFIYGYLEVTQGETDNLCKIRIGKVQELTKVATRLPKKKNTMTDIVVKPDKMFNAIDWLKTAESGNIKVRLGFKVGSGNKVMLNKVFLVNKIPSEFSYKEWQNGQS